MVIEWMASKVSKLAGSSRKKMAHDDTLTIQKLVQESVATQNLLKNKVEELEEQILWLREQTVKKNSAQETVRRLEEKLDKQEELLNELLKEHIPIEEKKEKEAPKNVDELSKECEGQRVIQSVHGTFLRADVGPWKVDLAKKEDRWEHWHVENWNGKVAFRAIHWQRRFMHATPGGDVTLNVIDRPGEREMWTPSKNDDGSWSFQNCNGKWLSAKSNGNVTAVGVIDSCERFWLGSW